MPMPMPMPMDEYVELHTHSNFSFQEGASTIEELVARAVEIGYPALALTDHDNLCGAMRFARKAKRVGLRPITGAEVSIAAQYVDSSSDAHHPPTHLTVLATSPEGYSNLCNLLSFSHYFGDRRSPELDPRLLPEHAKGLIALSGCARGAIPQALSDGRMDEAKTIARQYQEWFGEGNFYLELQRNLVAGDTQRNRRLVALGSELGIPLVATNNVHYHVKERHRLQDCLVAIRHRKSLEASHRERRPNAEFYLKSATQMVRLFSELPEALRNTMVITERCAFDMERDLAYRFPDYPVPEGHTTGTYLDLLCREAAIRKFGSISSEVDARLKEELRRITKHNLTGLLLIYHEIVGIAREVQVDLGLVDHEVPIEETPPGRGRGSSVALLMGYLLGISHIDPLQCGLTLDRFMPEELASVPDIDLDFPRDIREELIKRVHLRWGWQHAALTGAFSTYKIRGAIRDLGLALGLPEELLGKLAKGTEHATAQQVRQEMLAMPDFRDKVGAPVWRDLIALASQLSGFPRGLSQHPGGMLISSTPLIDQVPVHQAATEGRYLCHWDKNAIEDAGFVKIDLLAIGALSQMQEAVRLIEARTGEGLDLSRISFEDKVVYEMLHRADTIGIFQVESAAQMQTITRIKPINLTDMAYEVAAVRPGVGVNDGVGEFITRRTAGSEAYDHPLERRALERTLGVILFQDQVNQIAMDVAGFSGKEADELRRAYLRADEADYIGDHWWPKFRDGARAQGVDEETAARIFKKFNGQYMFPEAHAYAFGATAYQMAWLKCYYPLEFFVGLFNEQPMGFYNLETLKEDAKRHSVPVLHPDVNRSAARSTISETDSLLLGLLHVQGVGATMANAIVSEREASGPYTSVADLMERTGLRREALDNLADAGALDRLRDGASRRDARWEVGLRYRPVDGQMSLRLPVEQDMVSLPQASPWEVMSDEYRTLGVHPDAHLMAYLRDSLPGVCTSEEVWALADGTAVRVAGLVVRRQHPLAKAYFITLEDETGHAPLVVWPGDYVRLRHLLREPVLLIAGTVSRREGTMNVVVRVVEPIRAIDSATPRSKDWR
jgi:error-prone DNA polymerase